MTKSAAGGTTGGRAAGRAGPPLVVLLARALGRYRSAIRRGLEGQGFGDLPRSGSWVLGALRREPAALGELVERLGGSKQALSRLSDALVARGYVERAGDPRDRRRVVLALSARGRVAERVVRGAVREVDRELAGAAGPEAAASLRRALEALLDTPAGRR